MQDQGISYQDDGADSPATVIVIGRQFGSGGRRIGRLISQKTGYRYYDKELLAEAADSLGYSQDIFVANDERKPSPLKSLLQGVYGIADNFHDTSMCGESLYKAQSEVIKSICDSGSVVIVGRTADYVMRNHPGLVSVFLHSPVDLRASRIVERGESESIDSAMDMAKKNDRKREGYYNYFTGRSWGKASNYHLSIDVSAADDDAIADLIIEFARIKTGRKRIKTG